MKTTHLLTTLIFMGISHMVNSQDWEINGNTGITSSNYIGTQNAVPLQIRTDNTTTPQPIIFQTNGATERMRLTPTGELGLGTAAPSSLLHLTSTTSGNIFRTDGPAGSLNLWQLFTGGTEKFRLSVANSSSNVNINVFQTAHMLFSTSNTERMRLTSIGRLGLGIGAPVSLLHLHRDTAAVVHSRYTNTNTGSTASDGSRLGLEVDGDFRLVQFENLNTDIWTPNLALTNEIQRFRIRSNGQVFIGNGTMSENVINGAPLGGFGETSLLNVRGPINSCGEMSSLASQPVILYGYTSPNDGIAPTNDGFRMHMNLNFEENVNNDALVFEKTDHNDSIPDGYIAFTNTGNDSVERVSAYIDGNGRTIFGRNLLTPKNRVTIDSETGDASASGLQFIDLTSSSAPILNPGSGVLAVDSTGNVIYVKEYNDFAICDDSINGVLDDYSKLDLNNFNLYFTKNDTLGRNHVGIGYDCNDSLPGKVSSIQTHPFVISGAGTQTFAGHFRNIDSSNSFKTIFTGVYGEAIGQNMLDGAINFGGYFKADSARQSVGVAGISTGGAYSVGVYGEASGGTYVNYAGYFNGDVFGTAFYTPSDQNLKQNIQDFSNSNDVLSQLHPVSYDFKVTEYPQLNLESGQQIGFISQELEQVLPGAVKESRTLDVRDENGEILFPEVSFKAVAYEKLIPILVGGHQAQSNEISQLQLSNDSLIAQNQNLQQQISDLNNRFSQLESCLQAMLPGLCEIHHGIIQQNSTGIQEQYKSSINVKLSNKNTIVLNQNVPNPFAESTVINYSIPATVAKAQIHFYDGQGKLINSVEITNRGAGQLNVFGEDLSSGTYTYTLVADGQIVSTKKMVKE